MTPILYQICRSRQSWRLKGAILTRLRPVLQYPQISNVAALYGHPIHLLETFIDPGRFRGTCYRAANWIRLGLTTGRGHNDRTNRPNRPRKELWVYPLSADFRRHLCHAASHGL